MLESCEDSQGMQEQVEIPLPGRVQGHMHGLSRQNGNGNPVFAGCGLLCGQAPEAAF